MIPGLRVAAVLMVLSIAVPPVAIAQVAPLVGTVVGQGGEPIAGANVTIPGTGVVVVADADGRFRIPAQEAGDHRLQITAAGFGVTEHTVSVPAHGDPIRIVLRPDPVGLEALVVTGTRRRESMRESPVKVQVVPAAVLQRNATNNLTESLQFVNGLYNQVDCGVCYTNNLRINGMEGPYTAVLIDGMPLMSSLASVYGLNGINPALIQQVEIIKGPASTLYGSEAMAGVINVITKDPRFSPELSLDVSGTSDAEGNLDFGFSSGPGDVRGLLSGNLAYNDRFVDQNDDGFSDFPLVRRGVVFGKLDVSEEGARRGSLSAKYLNEDRFGGVEGWSRAHRGSDRVYGESVFTNRVELIGSWLPGWSDALRFEGSYTWHAQDSYYGADRYDATQHVGYGNLLWTRRQGEHDLLVGGALRYQSYDDNTPATREVDRRSIPGVFIQDEYRGIHDLTVLGGLRADHHEDHGFIHSPRLALKWEPQEQTAVRLNLGTGFRVVNLFTEDHAALTGAREVVIESELDPERSRSVTLNVNHVVEFGPNPMMIDLDLFHTRFSNKITPDYDRDPHLIVYGNLPGHAVSRGASLSFNQNVDFDRFLYSVGVTLQDVYSEHRGRREDEFFAPGIRGVASATYSFRTVPVRLDYTGSVTGPMRLPSYDEPFTRPERSPTYSLHNLQATWRLGRGSEIYLAAKNLLDYVQPSALVDPAHPFGESFDTAYVYGPLRGRHVMFGFRHGVSR